ncbi:uncharacterized protein LOC129293163 [Prosopis cineraria]|uniref:uncharacterized protein LOC129293163 n=1 Tax=Prosopis cineraria TaxID=364024 RepID=UPI00240FDDF6|nr:uncharacterized protein LOC129293163 [Prosopis cineraria]
MSSTTPMANQPPPQMQLSQQTYPTRSPHGSVGPVIAVLAVITVLGVIAGMIGRLCSGRRVMGVGEYDMESWVETKCSSCVDGRIPSPPPRRPSQPAAEDVGTPEEEAAVQEAREDEEQEAQAETAGGPQS